MPRVPCRQLSSEARQTSLIARAGARCCSRIGQGKRSKIHPSWNPRHQIAPAVVAEPVISEPVAPEPTEEVAVAEEPDDGEQAVSDGVYEAAEDAPESPEDAEPGRPPTDDSAPDHGSLMNVHKMSIQRSRTRASSMKTHPTWKSLHSRSRQRTSATRSIGCSKSFAKSPRRLSSPPVRAHNQVAF